MLRAIKLLLGVERDASEGNIDAEGAIAAPERAPASAQQQYNGRPVPLEASFDPDDCKSYCEWFEQYDVVPAKGGKSVLVFSTYFLSESSISDGASYNDWTMHADRRAEHPRRIQETISIYEQMHMEGAMHPRVVEYLGPTSSGYRLERLFPRPIYGYAVNAFSSDAALALCQRWALQLLSALVVVHSKGIVLNGIADEEVWLRSDYSVALAGFMNAACQELDIPAGLLGTTKFLPCQWGPADSGSTVPPYGNDEIGQPKRDIFDWAVFVFGLMTDGCNPLEYSTERANNTISSDEQFAKQEAVRQGEYNVWPELDKKMLGPQLLKAWRGEYESAEDALEDVRKALEDCGRILSVGQVDEIDGFVWSDLFKTEPHPLAGHLQQLCLR